ncbi:MAG: Cof-type HAD-IIB family hydrolase [Treponema sp.]|jgi:Cof subfamily protein (haloacid dehalogenase superfamily)|nr:Cof-type HAD-IIB family hydrolase [Treponema sp.]
MDEEYLRKTGQAVRLLVCDLDGTLLNSRKLISPENLAAIREAQAKGIFVTLCSGRVPEMLEAYARQLAIRGPLIAANGAVIFDTRTREMPYRNCADRERTRALLRFCLDRGMDIVVASSSGCWHAPGSARIRRFEQYNEIAGQYDPPLPPLSLRLFDPDYQEALGGAIYKVLVSGLSPEEQALVEEQVRSIGNLSVTSSEQGLADIGACGISKGEGIRILAELLGIERNKICGIGDYQNDIPMLEYAGLSIAMGNADDAVKSRALAVTAANDEDGVALAIRRFML